MANDNGTLQLMDIYTSAFIQLQGIEPSLLKHAGRVVFVFPNTCRVASLIDSYNLGPAGIRLLDYVQSLRRLRSRMISLRD